MNLSYAVQAVLNFYPYLCPDSVRRRLNYSTFVSVSNKYMYFEVPKAACTTMKALVNHIEHAPTIECFRHDIRESRRDMFIHDRANVPLPSLVDVDDDTQRQVLESPDFLRMTVVRNPYSRLFAAWRNKVLLYEPDTECVYLAIKGHLPQPGDKSLISFAEFVDYVEHKCDLCQCDPHWRLQVAHTFFRAMNFSFVGKMENMTEVLARLQGHLGLTLPLPGSPQNVSSLATQADVGEELWTRIYGLYRDDFETLHYERSSIPPYKEGNGTVPEDKYIDEVFERNLVIIHLYNQRAELWHELKRVDRLHLLGIAHMCLAVVRIFRKALANCHRWLVRFSLSGRRSGRPAQS